MNEPELVSLLSHKQASIRESAFTELYSRGEALGRKALDKIGTDALLKAQLFSMINPFDAVGLAVRADNYEKIKAAWSEAAHEQDVPAARQVREFHIDLGQKRLDVIGSTADGSAIDRHLERRGEGLQQVEFFVGDVAAATERLKALGWSKWEPVRGAGNALVNFSLIETADGGKVLVEFIESPAPSAARLAAAAVKTYIERISGLLAEGRTPSASDVERVARLGGFQHAGGHTLAAGRPAADAGRIESIRRALREKLKDRQALAGFMVKLVPPVGLDLSGPKFRVQEITVQGLGAGTAAAVSDDLLGIISLLDGEPAPEAEGKFAETQAREVKAVLQTSENTRALSGSDASLRRTVEAYNRGHALQEYANEKRNLFRGLLVDLNESLVLSADRKTTDGVIALDLFGARPESVDYETAAAVLAKQIVSLRDGGAVRVPATVLAVDVAEGSAADVENRLASALDALVRAGTINPAERDAARASWMAAPRESLEKAGVLKDRTMDAEKFHEWIGREKERAWNLGKNFVISVLTSDESRWKVSRKDFVRVLQVLLPDLAVRITDDLQEYLNSRKVIEIQA